MINTYLFTVSVTHLPPLIWIWCAQLLPEKLKIKMWCDLSSYVTLSVFIQLDISENQVEFK